MLPFITAGVTPTLQEAYKVVLPLATQWQNIGTLLDVNNSVLRRIETDFRSAMDCLREVLSYWLKATVPMPTWSALAEAVEPLDLHIAERIRERIDTATSATPRGKKCLVALVWELF